MSSRREPVERLAGRGVAPRAGAAGRRRLRRLAAAAATALLAAALVATAWAQLAPETELTPKAKPPSQWAVLGGARFSKAGKLVMDSPTPFTVDFFSTAFSPGYLTRKGSVGYLRDSVGFFAGAECVDESTPFAKLDECKRRPAIYGYGIGEFEQGHVDRLALGEGSSKPGFVGAVAWIDGRRALAVGGDGVYPRRESCDPTTRECDRSQGAGMARAWLYENGSWREIADLPPGMGALTALDCANPKVKVITGRTPPGTCLAGGLQQMWWWRPAGPGKPEGFDLIPVTGAQAQRNLTGSPLHGGPIDETGTPVAGGSVPVPPVRVADFYFRVRQIRFKPNNAEVIAVTSGCCASSDVVSGARLLTLPKYNEDLQKQVWRSGPFSVLGGDDASSRGAPLPDSYYAVVYGTQALGYELALQSGISAIASPGGPKPAGGSSEPGSRIVARVTGPFPGAAGPVDDPTSRALEAVRLLAADGDNFGTKPAYAQHLKILDSSSAADGMLDWAVGRFKNSEEGIAYTTQDSILPIPTPLTCSLDGLFVCPLNPLPVKSSPTPDTKDLESRRLVAMGTYALNALRFVPETEGSLGWAAGDRGALARLGGTGRLGAVAEPSAPALKPGQATALSERVPFDSFRPASGRARTGVVPALGDQPLERLPQKTLVPWGTADATLPWSGPNEAVTSIAMSRDGSEGWAVGSGGGNRFTLQHFDGERWSRCDPGGLARLSEPAPRKAPRSALQSGIEGRRSV